MTAGLSVDLRSPVPPFEQIRAQIASLITAGTLAPGTRLPTVRSLASDLGLAAGTVARAYKELELAGLVETRRRNGTVVAGTTARPVPAAAAVPGPPAGQAAAPAAPAEVIAAVDRYIADGRAAGLDDAALLAVLRAQLSQQDG
ncbi:GntR family transcriptional regulator [Arthrobacter sp. 2MCAF15]|uniref:GntR family transcriptional regulator n=1 Tax=Arthrobacter sp. 2MCAF15 TaxID=3232984 RepID=UPI003F8DBB5E